MILQPNTITVKPAGQLTKSQRMQALTLGQTFVPNEIPHLLYLAGLIGDRIVGVLYAETEDPCLIHVIATDIAHRRQGIGQRLLEDFEKRMAHSNRLEIQADCVSAESTGLFSKLGYTFSGKFASKDLSELVPDQGIE